MKNWVILFAKTSYEENLIQVLLKKLETDEFSPFIPTKETPYRSKGVIHKIRKPLFPGYIFIQTEVESEWIAKKLKTALKGAKDIYSLLHYASNENDVAVRESERLYWERLFDADYCITGSVGFIEGDKIQVTSGALIGFEGQIKRINRHKREAIVEMEMMGAKRDVTVMLEIVSVVERPYKGE